MPVGQWYLHMSIHMSIHMSTCMPIQIIQVHPCTCLYMFFPLHDTHICHMSIHMFIHVCTCLHTYRCSVGAGHSLRTCARFSERSIFAAWIFICSSIFSSRACCLILAI